MKVANIGVRALHRGAYVWGVQDDVALSTLTRRGLLNLIVYRARYASLAAAGRLDRHAPFPTSIPGSGRKRSPSPPMR